MKPKSWWEEKPDGLHNRWQIAESLKSNARAFGLLTEAGQEVMRECKVEQYLHDKSWGPTMALNHYQQCNYKHYTYRVRASFQPQYVEEEKPALIPFDPNYAPPGFVAVNGGRCGEDCDMHHIGKCSEANKYCMSTKRPDGIGAVLKRKPAPAWGDWVECEIRNNEDDNYRIRFRRGAWEVQGE